MGMFVVCRELVKVVKGHHHRHHRHHRHHCFSVCFLSKLCCSTGKPLFYHPFTPQLSPSCLTIIHGRPQNFFVKWASPKRPPQGKKGPPHGEKGPPIRRKKSPYMGTIFPMGWRAPTPAPSPAGDHATILCASLPQTPPPDTPQDLYCTNEVLRVTSL